MNQIAFESELKRKAARRHQDSLDEISRLLQQFTEPLQKYSELRAHPRYPICVRLRVTPCSSSFSVLAPPQVAFSQNLSAGGAALLLAEDPGSDYMRVEFGNNVTPLTLILRVLWKRPAGKFIEAGGTFIARL